VRTGWIGGFRTLVVVCCGVLGGWGPVVMAGLVCGVLGGGLSVLCALLWCARVLWAWLTSFLMSILEPWLLGVRCTGCVGPGFLVRSPLPYSGLGCDGCLVVGVVRWVFPLCGRVVRDVCCDLVGCWS